MSKDPLAPPPEPAPARADGAEIVDAIVWATLELDDPNASGNTIAERAGVGIASLYRYFPNKAAIFAEISRRMLRDFLVRLREALADPTRDLRSVVADCCRIAIAVPNASPRLRRHLNVGIPASWSEASTSATYQAAIAEMTRWLAVRLPEPPPDLAHRVFTAFAAARGVVMVAMILPDLRPPDEVVIDLMTRGALAYLGVPDPA